MQAGSDLSARLDEGAGGIVGRTRGGGAAMGKASSLCGRRGVCEEEIQGAEGCAYSEGWSEAGPGSGRGTNPTQQVGSLQAFEMSDQATWGGDRMSTGTGAGEGKPWESA
jgi:hypothetical protein